jgi:hypothetical protein
MIKSKPKHTHIDNTIQGITYTRAQKENTPTILRDTDSTTINTYPMHYYTKRHTITASFATLWAHATIETYKYPYPNSTRPFRGQTHWLCDAAALVCR